MLEPQPQPVAPDPNYHPIQAPANRPTLVLDDTEIAREVDEAIARILEQVTS